MGNRFALIIANDSFKSDKFQKLYAPRNDADAIYDILIDPEICGFPTENVTKIINPTLHEAAQQIEIFFGNRSSDDFLLLYFASHGEITSDNKLYFVIRDTDYSLPDSSGISSEFIYNQIRKCRSERQLLILDCCYSGRFLKGLIRGSGDNPLGTKIDFKDQLIPNGYGIFVLAASTAVQMAYDVDEEDLLGNIENSLFARHFIQGLRTGDADIDGDGITTIHELYNYLYTNVSQDAKRRGFTQEPTLNRQDERGNFRFALNKSHRIGMYIFEQHGNQMNVKRLPIKLKDQSGESPNLYLLPNQKQSDIIVVNRQGNLDIGISDTITFMSSAKPIKQYFRLTVKYDYIKKDYIYNIDNGELDFNYQPKDLNFKVGEVIGVHNQKPTQICYVIDGTMQGDELTGAISFARDTAAEILTKNAETEFGCVVYGEHLRMHDGSMYKGRNTFPFDILTLKFGTFTELDDFLESLSVDLPSESFMGQDYCDGLEVALQKLIDFAWTVDTRHIVIIGNSPPHPTTDELGKYGLLDFSVDEFGHESWNILLEKIANDDRNHLAAYWIEPKLSMPSNIMRFAEYSWKKFNNSRNYGIINSEDSLNSSIMDFVNRVIMSQELELERRLRLPLLR